MKRRMLIRIAITTAVLFIVITLVFAAFAQQERGLSNYSESVGPVTYIGKPVFVLGESQNTGFIVDRLWLGTHNITVVEDISNLSVLNPGDLLMIDGEWAARYSLRDLADAIRPLILQGTPVVLLNMTSDLLNLTVENDSWQIGYCYYSVGGSQETMVPTMFNGFIYFPSENRTDQIGLAHRDSPESFANLITTLYEWSALRT